jgi:capsular exopolysaccharide synthesis family protein
MTDPRVPEALRQYWAVLHKRRILVAACAGAALLVAAVHDLTSRRLYEATVQLLVDLDFPDVLSARHIVEGEEAEGEDTRTQYELLRSRTLAEAALERLGPEAQAELGHLAPFQLAEAFRSRLTVEGLPTTRLVNLRFRAHDPAFAARAANLLADLYVEQWLEFRFATSREAAAWLARQVRVEEAGLRAAEEAAQRFRERHGLVARGTENGSDPTLTGLTEALMGARTERVALGTLYGEIEGAGAAKEAYAAVRSDRVVSGLREELAGLRDEEARLAENLGDRHPRMLDVRSRARVVEERLRSAVEAIVQGLRAQYELAVAREARLAGEAEGARRAAFARAAAARRLAALEQEVETRRQAVRDLARRREEAALDSRLRATNLRVVEKAEPPAAPVLPERGRNYRLAFVLGLAAGVFLAVMLDRVDDSVRTPEHVTAELRLPFLGLVPRFGGSPRGPEPPHVVREPGAALAEAYRVVRTNLVFLSSFRRGGGVILVSSSVPGEGKTTTAANLAAALALNGSQVLAVDADLRRPSLHEQFGLRAAPGLSEVLARSRRAGRLIRPTPVRGLRVLPSGETPPNPSELLGSERLRRLLATERRRYQWIVIDAPPILALSDAPVLCTLVDGLVLVVWAEATGFPSVRRALEQVAQVGGRLAGVVLNKVDLAANAAYYSYYHPEYYYGYYAATPALAAGS